MPNEREKSSSNRATHFLDGEDLPFALNILESSELGRRLLNDARNLTQDHQAAVEARPRSFFELLEQTITRQLPQTRPVLLPQPTSRTRETMTNHRILADLFDEDRFDFAGDRVDYNDANEEVEEVVFLRWCSQTFFICVCQELKEKLFIEITNKHDSKSDTLHLKDQKKNPVVCPIFLFTLI